MRGRGTRRVCSLAIVLAMICQLIIVVPAAAKVRRELIGKRTHFSRTFSNGDGTYDLEAHAGPIHYLDELTGRFQPIDPSLVESATTPTKGEWHTVANEFRVKLPKKAGSDWISIETTQAAVRYRPASRLNASAARARESTGEMLPMDGTKLTYKEAYAGAELEYLSLARGLKETIVLPAFSGASTFSFDMVAQNVAPVVNAQGGIDFVSADSTSPVFSIAPPYMTDSSRNERDEPAFSDAVHYELTPQPSGWRLDVVADEAWLRDASRVYPVRIDPTTWYAAYCGGQFASDDTFVANGYPTSNFENYWDSGAGVFCLRAGYSSGNGGTNRLFVKPLIDSWISDFKTSGLNVIFANLKLYNYYAGVNRDFYVDRVDGAWGRGSLTWNNKPAVTWYGGTGVRPQANSYSSWSVTSMLNDIINQNRSYYGFMILASPEDSSAWAKFYSSEQPANDPYIEIRYTTKPKVTLTAPTTDTPPGAGVRAMWSYADGYGKTQDKVEVEVKQGDIKATTTAWNSGQLDNTTSYLELSKSDFTNGRYYIRMRAAGKAEDNSLTWSDWTSWQEFDFRSLTDEPTTGIEPYRASDSLGGGASVDLASGRLQISRSDFSGPGLGSPLGVSAFYDSGNTADGLLGRGWRLGVPTFTVDAQRAPNPGFESGTSQVSGWYNSSAYASRDTVTKRTDGASLKFYVPPADGFKDAYVQTVQDSDSATALKVHPGQRLRASAWVKTSSLVSNTQFTERGAVMKIHFYDAAGTTTYFATVMSESFTQGTTVGWVPISFEAVVPEGGYRATLTCELRRAYGTVNFDDVYFGDSTLTLTDADGTTRAFNQTGDGTYERDPLVGKAGFKRTNAAAGATVYAVTNSGASSSTVEGRSVDGIINNVYTLGNYDQVSVDPAGSKYLEYRLKTPAVLSEAAVYLWNGPESPARTYDYAVRLHNVRTDSWETTVVSKAYARGWNRDYFAPTKVDAVRVYALANTVNSWLHVCELELPVTTLAAQPVAFDGAGTVTGVADLSGNVTRQVYSQGKLTQLADTAGRHLDLGYSGSRLETASWTGVDSAGSARTETDVVKYDYTSGVAVKRRKDDGSYQAMVTYGYDANGRISSVTDADGVRSTIEYSGSKVATVTRTGEGTTTPDLVTTYSYSSGAVDITTRGGTDSVTRRVEFSSSVGGQVTKTIQDPGAGRLQLTTSIAYDAFGHVKQVTDPNLKSDTFVTDAHGNVVNSLLKGSIASTATFADDRVTSTTDPKGNTSSYQYDAQLRPMTNSTAMTDVDRDGEYAAAETYDEWGNRIQDDSGGSTTFSLLDNGILERDPKVSGNGWDGAGSSGLVWSWETTIQPYVDHYLRISGANAWKESDAISVKPDTTYALSLWGSGSGNVKVTEFNAGGQLIASSVVVAFASGSSAPGSLTHVAGTFTAHTGAATARVALCTNHSMGALFDNVRVEEANASGGDNYVDNESFERLNSASPDNWYPRAVGIATMDTVTSARVSGTRAARLVTQQKADGTGDGYWVSGYIPIDRRHRYSVATFVKLDNVVSTLGGGVRPGVSFYDRDQVQLSGSDGWQSITATLTGSAEWQRYVAPVSTPRFAEYMRVDLHSWLCTGTAYFDAVSVEPRAVTAEYGFDAGTHTFAVESTGVTGARTQTDYDARGRATQVRYAPADTFSVEQSATFDALDRLSAVALSPGSSDPNERSNASFGYTQGGRLRSVTDPLGRTGTISYNAAGQVTTATSPLGMVSENRYDGLGRLSATLYPRAVDSTVAPVLTSRTYDAASRVTSETVFQSSGTVAAAKTYAYDPNSNVTTETLSGVVAAAACRSFDDLNRLTSLRVSGPAGDATLTPSYDSASLMTGLSWSGLGTSADIANTYAKTGQWSKTTGLGYDWMLTWRQNGGLAGINSSLASRYLDYDSTRRLSGVRLAVVRPGNTKDPYADIELGYDDHDRISSVTYRDSGASGLPAGSESYGYDSLDRLTSWTKGSATSSYAYDAAGNLKSRTEAGVTTDFAHDAGNRLTTATAGGVTTTFGNDDFGRRTSRSGDASATYAWNAQGQLSGVVTGDTTATYTYGISGMREMKSIGRDGIATTSTALWSGGTLLAEREGDSVYSYLYGSSGAPLQVRVTSGGTNCDYAYHLDAGGSVIALTDISGNTAASYSYDPWGNPVSVGGSNPALANRQPLRYRGYYYDTESGFYYLPNRYYDPGTARFLSVDPAGPAAGNPLTLNDYTYCENDPVNASDPSGAIMRELYVTTDSDSIPESSRREAYQVSIARRHRFAGQYDRAAEAEARAAAIRRERLAAQRLRFGQGAAEWLGGLALQTLSATIMQEGAQLFAASGTAGAAAGAVAGTAVEPGGGTAAGGAGGAALGAAAGAAVVGIGAFGWIAGASCRNAGRDDMEAAVGLSRWNEPTALDRWRSVRDGEGLVREVWNNLW